MQFWSTAKCRQKLKADTRVETLVLAHRVGGWAIEHIGRSKMITLPSVGLLCLREDGTSISKWIWSCAKRLRCKSYLQLDHNVLMSYVVTKMTSKSFCPFSDVYCSQCQTNRNFTIHRPIISNFAWQVKWSITVQKCQVCLVVIFKSLWKLSSHESTKYQWTIWICLWFSSTHHGSYNAISRNYIGRFKFLDLTSKKLQILKSYLLNLNLDDPELW